MTRGLARRIVATTAGLALAVGAITTVALHAAGHREAECPGAWAVFCEMDEGTGR